MKFRRKKDDSPNRQRPIVMEGQRTQVFSYYASQRQAQQQSKTGRRHSAEPFSRNPDAPPERFNWKRLPTYIAVGVIGLCLIIATTLSGSPKVHVRLETTGEQMTLYRPIAAYQEVADEALSRSIFNKSKLTVQRDVIADSILARLPEVTNVKLATPLVSRNLIVTMETNAPGMIVETPSGAFVIDTTGTVITTLKQAPAVVTRDLPTIIDLADPQITLGKPLFSAQEVAFAVDLSKELAAIKLEVAKLTMPSGIANELHVTFKGSNYFVKFAMNGDARLQAGTYAAVKQNLAKQGTVPGEYIDVRVEGRAYYK